jgi:regulator of sigma E protease
MTLVLSALAFLLLLTVLILLHELGHFTLARLFRVRVEEFGFGLPPRAKRLFVLGDTLFSLNWVPFGGFVRLQGETSLDPLERERRGSFAAASIPARLCVLSGGVGMNVLLALFILTLGFWLWMWVPTYLDLPGIREGAAKGEVDVTWGLLIAEVLPGSNAEKGGVASGGLLMAVNRTPVTSADEVLSLQQAALTQYPATIEYQIQMGPEFEEERTFFVELDREGKTGIALSTFARRISGRPRTLVQAVPLAIREVWTITVETVRGAGRLVLSLLSTGQIPEGITGIVGIAQLTHVSVQEGFLSYLRLVALLSLSLAVLNILPFPALDGGRVLFVLVELLARRPLYRRVEVLMNGIGFVLLLALIAAITVKDVLRIFLSPL